MLVVSFLWQTTAPLLHWPTVSLLPHLLSVALVSNSEAVVVVVCPHPGNILVFICVQTQRPGHKRWSTCDTLAADMRRHTSLTLGPGIILGTHREKGAYTFWSYALGLPLASSSILSWKFCHVLHKVLRDGHQNVRTPQPLSWP